MARTHFVRFLKRKQVNETIDMLNASASTQFPHVTARQETFKIKAPDGDEVFSGMLGPQNTYLCRLHKEVFSQ